MKKVISVLLAAVMLLCFVPFTVFAEGADVDLSGEYSTGTQLLDGTTYVVRENTTLTIPVGKTLYVPSGATLKVEQGGTLKVKGKVVVFEGGTLLCDGIIEGSNSIEVEKNATAKVKFRFPSLSDPNNKLDEILTVNYAYDFEGETFEASASSFPNPYFPLNTKIRICVHIMEPDPTRDKFDDSLLDVKFNNVVLPYMEGKYYIDDLPASTKQHEDTGYFYTTATTGGDIALGKWTNDSNYLTTKKIILPSGEGYECVSRYPVNKTEDGTIIVKYGEPFAFKVELDEAYDMSSYQVYIYNGYGWLNLITNTSEAGTFSLDEITAQPDEFGYYNIGQVTTDLTVTVTGVMKNSTISLIGNLLETFRSIFNMLKEFFEGIRDMFNGG